MQQKTCSKCFEAKNTDQFNKKQASKDGLASMCRTCHEACRGTRTGKFNRMCGVCGSSFETANRYQVRCSQRCKRMPNQNGPNNPNWRGGLITSSKGYVYMRQPDHPRASNNGYVKRADLVMEATLGRPLQPGEEVHHKNNIKNDDIPSNLEVLTQSEHSRIHGEESHQKALSIKRQRHNRNNEIRVSKGWKPLPFDRHKIHIDWPTEEELRALVATSSYRKVAKSLGVSHISLYRRLNDRY